jgi:signal transduction histidine kinase
MRFVDHPKAAERLLRAVDDLDATIKIIRSTIFGLRAHDAGPYEGGLRRRIAEAVQDVVPALGFTPALRTEGLLDTEVPADVADQAVAVLREALSNAARHAEACSVEVSVETAGDMFALCVEDDGEGITAEGRQGGLNNLAERADRLDGELRLETPEGGGTRLVWRVPMRRPTG